MEKYINKSQHKDRNKKTLLKLKEKKITFPISQKVLCTCSKICTKVNTTTTWKTKHTNTLNR